MGQLLPGSHTLSLFNITLTNQKLSAILVFGIIAGGYLLTREGKGKTTLEVLALILFIAATVISDPSPVSAFITRVPLAASVLGLAWITDKGFKILPGLALLIGSGYLVIVH